MRASSSEGLNGVVLAAGEDERGPREGDMVVLERVKVCLHNWGFCSLTLVSVIKVHRVGRPTGGCEQAP